VAANTFDAVDVEWLPALDIEAPARQRRWTVLLRLLLLIPQFVVLWVLEIVATIVVIIGWFGALLLGRLPGFAARYLGGFLAYSTRVLAYAMLLVDRYPPFAMHAPEHPVQIELRPGHLNRPAVFFRLILMIPALIVQSVAAAGWWACSVLCWLVVLILGRNPQPLFQATAAILRYVMRYDAYMLLLTSAYPKRLFGDGSSRDLDAAQGEARSATRPLVLTGGAKGLIIAFMIIGVASDTTASFGTSSSSDSQSTAAS
jgi:Domain of unknown function (DUF4389)